MNFTEHYSEEKIEELLKDFILREIMYERADIVLSNDLPLLQNAIIDSLGIVKLHMFIEETFKLTIKQEEIFSKNFETVDAIKFLVLKSLKKLTFNTSFPEGYTVGSDK